MSTHRNSSSSIIILKNAKEYVKRLALQRVMHHCTSCRRKLIRNVFWVTFSHHSIFKPIVVETYASGLSPSCDLPSKLRPNPPYSYNQPVCWKSNKSAVPIVNFPTDIAYPLWTNPTYRACLTVLTVQFVKYSFTNLLQLQFYLCSSMLLLSHDDQL